jgi:phosphatidate cytidylyltransferase
VIAEMTTIDRMLGFKHAFDHPVTIGIVSTIAIALVVSSILVRTLHGSGKLSDATFDELIKRIRSWLVLCAAMVIPILLGAAWVCLFFLALSLTCWWEFTRATDLKRRSSMVPVMVAILATYFAVLDHWMGFFAASWALGMCLIATVALWDDEPTGYIKRVSIAIIGYALFGVSLGHLAFIGNDVLFRPILLWLLFCTELNDVLAYISGKTMGKRKLLPNTSPNKTWGGALGAIVLTTTVAAFIGHFVFLGTRLEHPIHLICMGFLISVFGQCGDLVISSFKRDLNIKDMSNVIPGHGGVLDRFDSLLLVSPILFHYINYFRGIGIGQPTFIFTGYFN